MDVSTGYTAHDRFRDSRKNPRSGHILAGFFSMG